MFRVCVQNGFSHKVLIEGSHNQCAAVYDTSTEEGIIYMQEHRNHAHIPNPSLSGYWIQTKERRYPTILNEEKVK